METGDDSYLLLSSSLDLLYLTPPLPTDGTPANIRIIICTSRN